MLIAIFYFNFKIYKFIDFFKLIRLRIIYKNIDTNQYILDIICKITLKKVVKIKNKQIKLLIV